MIRLVRSLFHAEKITRSLEIESGEAMGNFPLVEAVQASGVPRKQSVKSQSSLGDVSGH